MIAKISTGSSPRGALNYNYDKLEAGEAKLLQTNRIWKKYSGMEFSANELAFIFEERAAINENTKKPFVHISLNPSPDDHLTDEQLTQIADEYMEKMGYGNQPYIVFKHEDIERHHLHIVTTNIDAQGKKINDSNNFYNSKRITNEIERKYNLHPADLKKDSKVWIPDKIDPAKNISNQVRNTVKHLVNGYNFQSFNEYKALLSLYNIEAQEIKGEAAGNLYNGLLYSAIDDNKERVANPIKSSALGKFAGATNLSKKYEKSIPNLKLAAADIRQTLSKAIDIAKTEEDLTATLKKENIDLILRKNGEGRIYGVTIVDHKTKSVMNGSRLGKEFSANRFHEMFSPNNKTEDIDVGRNATLEHIAQPQEDQKQHLFTFNTTGGASPFAGGGGGSSPKKKKKKKKKNLSV